VIDAESMLKEMQTLETRLLHGEYTHDCEALERLLAEEFEEVTPQGQLTSRAGVLQWLRQKDPAHRWQFNDWQVTELAAAVRLVRYHAVQVIPLSRSRGAMHCSLWVHDSRTQCWRLRFHQSSRMA
jgi:hypothetical protein